MSQLLEILEHLIPHMDSEKLFELTRMLNMGKLMDYRLTTKKDSNMITVKCNHAKD